MRVRVAVLTDRETTLDVSLESRNMRLEWYSTVLREYELELDRGVSGVYLHLEQVTSCNAVVNLLHLSRHPSQSISINPKAQNPESYHSAVVLYMQSYVSITPRRIRRGCSCSGNEGSSCTQHWHQEKIRRKKRSSGALRYHSGPAR